MNTQYQLLSDSQREQVNHLFDFMRNRHSIFSQLKTADGRVLEPGHYCDQAVEAISAWVRLSGSEPKEEGVTDAEAKSESDRT